MYQANTKYDAQRGVIKYAKYDTEQDISFHFDNLVNIKQNEDHKIQFKLLNGEIVYNHYDEGLQAYEGVNHPLTGNCSNNASLEFIQVTTTSAIVLNQDLTGFTQSVQNGSNLSL